MSTAEISLYFGVEDGKNADLEAIARASLEWIEAIRDMASIIAPETEVEIEFLQTKEGSVWLKNLIKAVRDGDQKAMGAVAIATVIFFGLGPALHLQQDFGDGFWSLLGHDHEEVASLSEEEKQAIVDAVLKAVDQTQMDERRRQMVRAVETDPSITSIGVSTVPRMEGPIPKITRDQFPSYGASAPKERPKADKETTIQNRVRVKVIRATLRPGETKPRWRFSSGDGEWSADIEDEEFVWAINADQTGLHLAVGQEMVVDFAIDQRFVEDAWNEENRRILRVRSPHVDRRQSGFWPDD